MLNIGRFIKVERENQNLDQSFLCEGICSNSYLSKIENLDSIASTEIITLLVNRLGYQFEENLDLDFELLNTQAWEAFLYDFELDDNLIIRIKEAMNKKKFSRYSTDAFLLSCLYMLIKGSALEQNYEYPNIHFDVLQKQRYDIIYCESNIDSIYIKDFLMNYRDDIGYVSERFALKNHMDGDYFKAIEFAKKSYELYSNKGNIKGMIKVSFTESNANSNLGNLSMHELLSERILKLNRYIGFKSIEYDVKYNLGSSYLVAGDLVKARDILMQCVEITINEDIEKLYLYEKILILAFKSFDHDLYNDYFDHINTEIISYDFFKELKNTNFNLKSDSVVIQLEKCYEYEKGVHHGRSMLFGSLLYQSYRSKYLYPKAVKLLEEISHAGTYLFFEK